MASRETRIGWRDALRRQGTLYQSYVRFELVVSAVLLIFVSIIIVYSLAVLAVTLSHDLAAGVHMNETAALKDTFGLILSILILVEFNHSIALGIRRRSGVLQVRVIVLITIIVIARKLILLDYPDRDLAGPRRAGTRARSPPFAAQQGRGGLGGRRNRGCRRTSLTAAVAVAAPRRGG